MKTMMISTRTAKTTSLLSPLLFVSLVVSFITTAVEGSATTTTSTTKELIDWITSKENGGYYNPKQNQQTDGSGGIIATEDIEKDELLLSVPWKIIIGHEGYKKWAAEEAKKIVNGDASLLHAKHRIYDDDYEDHEDDYEYEDIVADEDCSAIRSLLEEVKLGSSSKYATHLKYLNLIDSNTSSEKDDNFVGIPTVWSQDGKDLLESLTGEGTILPPHLMLFSLLNHDMYGKCVIDTVNKIDAGKDDENIRDPVVRKVISTVMSSSTSLPPPESVAILAELTAKRALRQQQQRHHQRPPPRPKNKKKTHHDRGLIVPLMDNAYYNHGRFTSVNVMGRIKSSAGYELYATKKIPKGTSIVRSYTNEYDEDDDDYYANNDDDDDGEIDYEDAEDSLSTPELFRDYGIIEKEYPQLFRFAIEKENNGENQKWGEGRPAMKEVYTFVVDRTIEEGEEFYQLSPVLDEDDIEDGIDWNEEVLPFMTQNLNRLDKLERMVPRNYAEHVKNGGTMTKHEWDTSYEYHQLMKDTMKQIVQYIRYDVNADDESMEMCPGGYVKDKGSAPCEFWNGDYDQIPDQQLIPTPSLEYDEMNPYGPSDYAYQMCNDEDITEWGEYNSVWGPTQPSIKSHYQEIFFFHHPLTKDMCMKLDGTVQQCTSYRPHYHEFAVHFPSRFIHTIQRVLFVGGGDSMVLHDVLKYPSLELVVGLELDQFVLRNSFKYFHTQPHFDDPRVQWWFGDGAKSLLMLPKSYFGSFDLVVVDLSETVMSFQVTDKLSIFQTLSLLLKPEGIMLKNGEYYMDSMSSHFDYTLQYFEYDVPFICDQGMVIGSNGINFFNDTRMKDHNVETLVYESQQDILDNQGDDPFYRFTEYRKNDAKQQGQCEEDAAMTDDDIYKGDRKQAGILMVVEGEYLGESTDVVIGKDSIIDALKKVGLKPISTVSSSEGGVSTIVVIMEEGYINARIWAELSYCALDIQLWGGFHLMDETKKALIVDSFGGSEKFTSSFRLVDGGMYGTKTAQQDLEMIGPRIANTRNCDDDDDGNDGTCDNESGTCANDDNGNTDTETIIIEESLSLTGGGEGKEDEVVIAVLCGKEGRPCKSLDVLNSKQRSDDSKIKKVIPIRTCKTVAEGSDLWYDLQSEKISIEMTNCEVDTFQTLMSSDDDKLSLLVIDESAERVMLQMLLSIFADVWNRKRLVSSDQFAIVVPTTTEETVSHRNFLVMVRDEVLWRPMSLADVIVKKKGDADGDNNDHAFSILSLNDSNFFIHLHGMVSSFNDRANDTMEVKSIYDGLVRQQLGPFRPKIFKPDDYDLNPGKEQLAAQKSLGRQSLYQFDVTNYRSAPSVALSSVIKQSIAGMGWTLKQEVGRYGVNDDDDGTDNSKIGDGAAFVGIFSNGNIVVVWDGKNHVDANLFTLDKKEELRTKFATVFTRYLQTETKGTVSLALSDTHPRGIGRVVSFPKGN